VSGRNGDGTTLVCCKLNTLNLVLALFLLLPTSSCQILTTEAAPFPVLVALAVVNGSADTRPCLSAAEEMNDAFPPRRKGYSFNGDVVIYINLKTPLSSAPSTLSNVLLQKSRIYGHRRYIVKS